MEFLSIKNNLRKGLFIVSHIAGKNVNLPILNNVMIEAEEGNIKLTTTDLETGITHYLRGKTEKEGVFTVNSKMISDYINLLPDKKIKIKQQKEELEIECENYHTKIKGQSSEDFPLIPQVEKKEGYKTGIKEFKKALSRVVFAASTAESRAELNGILFSINQNELTLVSTDSYRLAEKKVKIENKNKNEKEVIVPAKTIQELLRILSGLGEDGEIKEEEEVDFFITENQILFSTNSTELVSRLIEGQYPDYKQIIPNKSQTKAKVDKNELIRAVKTSSLFSKTGVNDINLDFPKEKNQIIVSSTSGQTGENIVKIDSQTQGEDNRIIINYQYLLDNLKTIEEEEIEIKITDSNTPCVITPIKEKDYLYIIMPIKQ